MRLCRNQSRRLKKALVGVSVLVLVSGVHSLAGEPKWRDGPLLSARADRPGILTPHAIPVYWIEREPSPPVLVVQPIGLPVGSIPGGPELVIPLDLGDDDIWEFAISTGGIPPMVGVYSPALSAWLDGPRSLPVSSRTWGAGDYDNDGDIDYAYPLGDTIFIFDTRTESAEAVWSMPAEHGGSMTFWGRTKSGKHTLVSIKGFSQSSIIGEPPYQSSSSQRWYVAFVHALETGEFLYSIEAGLPDACFLYGVGDDRGPGLAVQYLYTSSWTDYGSGRSRQSIDQQIRVLDHDWSEVKRFALDTWYDSPYQLPWYRLRGAAILPTDEGQYPNLLVLAHENTYQSHRTLGYHSRVDFWDWIVRERRLNPAPLELFDSLGVNWILPLSSGAGWERRQVQDGEVIDTIEGMPAVNLHSWPLFEAGVPDVFYFLDSSLYIYTDTASTLRAEFRSGGIPPPGLSLSPNPFNAECKIRCEFNGEASLTIFNVLGQRVREFLLSASDEGREIVWDGRDAAGNIASSGIYFVRLRTTTGAAHARMALLR